jgi:tetratricopeptide (TPR) repeat protein
MSRLASRVSVAVLSCLCFTSAVWAQAQEKAAPKQIPWARASDDAHQMAFQSYTESVAGFGGRAIDLARMAVTKDPTSMLARATSAFTAGNASELDKLSKEAAAASLGESLIITAWRERQAGRNANALALAKAAAELYPDGVIPAIEVVINGNIGAEKHRSAAAAYREVAKKFNFPAAYAPAAARLLAAGDTAAAVETANEYASVAPDDPRSHVIAGNYYRVKGDLQSASAHYQKAIQVDAKFAQAHAAFAQVEQFEGRGQSAREHLQHAIANANSDVERLGFLRGPAISYVDEGKLKLAEQEVMKTFAEAEKVGANAQTVVWHRNMAFFNALNGKKSEIAQHFSEAEKLNDNPVTLKFTETYTYTVAGMPEQADAAVAGYIKAIGATPTPVQQRLIHMVTGISRMAHNDAAGALEHLGQADQNNPAVMFWQAKAHKKLGHKGDVATLKQNILSNATFVNFGQLPQSWYRAEARKL